MSASVSSSNIELQPIQYSEVGASPRPAVNDSVNFLPQPSTTVSVVERWNHPRSNLYRTSATFFSFVVMGANDAAYGALIPYLESYYGLSYLVVSLVFLSPLAGYAAAATLNNFVHVRLGQRGVAFIAPFCHICAYLGVCLHPPYPVVVVVYILAGFGNGLADAAWNAWLGNMANSNEVLGFLHGFYGIGAVVSPLVATALITKAGWPWYSFYYIMLGGAVIELITSMATFWKASASAYREAHPAQVGKGGSVLRESLSNRVTWVASLFLLCYVGVEVALGGWIVTFMIRERGGQDFASGMVGTGFWAGIAAGRIALGFITPKVGEKFALMLYIPAAMFFQLIFWLVPSFPVSAVAVSLQGFFLGPMFPAAVVAATRILPAHLHVSAIGFTAAFGGGGAAVLPFAIGALAQAKGVSILQPIILAFLALLLVLWMCFPAISKKTTSESTPASQPSQRTWFNIDVDLFDVIRKAIKKARGC